MILIVGATGRLGSRVTRRLLAQGQAVRAVTRTPDKAGELTKLGADVVYGDLRDPASLARACQGVEKVLAAAHAFEAVGDNNPQTVDGAGNRALIDAARAAGVQHFVFTSIIGIGPHAPIDLFRLKYEAEQYLKASGLSYTIVRAAAFMEFWAKMVGEPIVKTGKTTIFGRGDNPINFVSVEDVAHYAVIALQEPKARNQTLEVGGPENLSLNQVAAIFEKVTGRAARKNHVPLPMMRVMSVVMRPIKPALARQIAAGVYMDTADQTFDMTRTLKQYPAQLTRLEQVARRLVAESIPAGQVTENRPLTF